MKDGKHGERAVRPGCKIVTVEVKCGVPVGVIGWIPSGTYVLEVPEEYDPEGITAEEVTYNEAIIVRVAPGEV